MKVLLNRKQIIWKSNKTSMNTGINFDITLYYTLELIIRTQVSAIVKF